MIWHCPRERLVASSTEHVEHIIDLAFAWLSVLAQMVWEVPCAASGRPFASRLCVCTRVRCTLLAKTAPTEQHKWGPVTLFVFCLGRSVFVSICWYVFVIVGFGGSCSWCLFCLCWCCDDSSLFSGLLATARLLARLLYGRALNIVTSLPRVPVPPRWQEPQMESQSTQAGNLPQAERGKTLADSWACSHGAVVVQRLMAKTW